MAKKTSPAAVSEDLEDSAIATMQHRTLRELKQDLNRAARILKVDEVRYLVDLYYEIQGNRIRAANQTRQVGEAGEPNALVAWIFEEQKAIEDTIRLAMKHYVAAKVIGRWLTSHIGVGPVISAGLMAHLNFTGPRGIPPTVGHWWSFGGMNPEQKWEKGQKRPFNMKLKTLCLFKMGESFVKFQNHPECYYGKLFRQYKDREIARNTGGEYKDKAAETLEQRKIDKSTPTYKAYAEGKFPDGRVHNRARRKVVKLFLAHLHDVVHRVYNGKPSPLPYAQAFQDHAHHIITPNLHLLEGHIGGGDP